MLKTDFNWNYFRDHERSNIHVIGVSRKEEKKLATEKIFEEIIAETCHRLYRFKNGSEL